MSFDPIESSPDPFRETWLIVALWCLPVILYVLRRQLSMPEPFRRYLQGAQWVSVLGAIPFSLAWLGLLGPTEGLLRAAAIYLASAVCLALVGMAALRWSRKGGSGGVV